MSCRPPVSVEVVSVAVGTPATRASALVPRVMAPLSSKKVTFPVAVEGDTVAVKVTESPYVDAFSLDPRSVVVFPGLTTWLRADAVVLPASSVSPP
jgi:hypothetical protein